MLILNAPPNRVASSPYAC